MTKNLENLNKSLAQSNIIPLNLPKIPLPKWDENWNMIWYGEKVLDKSSKLNQEIHFNFSDKVRWRENSFPQDTRRDIIPEVMDRYLNFIPGGYYCTIFTTPPKSEMAVHTHATEPGDMYAINMTWGEGEHFVDFYDHDDWSVFPFHNNPDPSNETTYAYVQEEEYKNLRKNQSIQTPDTCLFNLATIHGVRNLSDKPRTTLQFTPYKPLSLEIALKNLKNRVNLS